MYGFVYMTTNLVNGKKYIGQKCYSCRNCDSYLGSGLLLQRAVEKFGKENFTRVTLEECETREKLNEREQYYISLFNAVESDEFYNLAPGGEGLKEPSDLLRDKMSKAHIGKKQTEETKHKRAEKQFRKVLCIDLNILFDSITQAAEQLNVDSSGITKVCRGVLRQTGGHTFKYAD